MKILLIHNQYIFKGGEDTVFEAEYALLKKYGHDVQTLVFNNKNIVSIKDKILAGIMTFFNIHSAKILKQKILKFQPNIIHVHNFFPIASPSIFFVAHRLNIPIVMTLHNYRLICPNALLFRNGTLCEICINKKFALDGVMHGCYRQSKLQTFLLAMMTFIHNLIQTWQTKIDRLIVLTEFAKNKFLDSALNIDENRIVKKSNFVSDRGYELNKNDYCLFIGRLSEEKGINVLLRTFENSDKKLFIIGSGPLENEVKESEANNNNIKFLGYRNIEFIIQILEKAKVLIFPSLCYEGMPMSILESFSTATPVICSNIGGSAELVTDHKNGLHFIAGNTHDLSEKIDWIYNHPDEYQMMCTNARNEYETKYTEEKNYTMLMKIYEEVILEKKNS